MPKTAVCIVTCDRVNFLQESLRSVLNQTYSDFDIVILDNCSEDETGEFVASVKDPRVRYIRHAKRIYAHENFNFALKETDADYISIFHDDDRMFPWMVEKLVETLDSYPSVGMAASCSLLTMGGPVPPYPKRITGRRFKRREFIAEYARTTWNNVVCPSLMVRKKVTDESNAAFGPYDIVSDLFFHLQVNAASDIFLINDPLLEYRQHAGQLSYARKPEEMVVSNWKLIDDYISGQNSAHGLGIDFSALRAKFAWHVFDNIDAAALGRKEGFSVERLGPSRHAFKGNFSSLLKKRKALETEHGWRLTDEQFYDVIARAYFKG
jgi:glycosyltransferase involved in cell wall biosynthesis